MADEAANRGSLAVAEEGGPGSGSLVAGDVVQYVARPASPGSAGAPPAPLRGRAGSAASRGFPLAGTSPPTRTRASPGVRGRWPERFGQVGDAMEGLVPRFATGRGARGARRRGARCQSQCHRCCW